MIEVNICSDLEPKKIKFFTVYIISPFIGHEVMGLDAKIFIFLMPRFKTAFSLSFSISSGGSLVPFCFLP